MTTNYQLDEYLGNLRNLELIPAGSYEELFTPYGNLKKNINIGSKSYATIINMDRSTGLGTHWVAMIFTPGAIYYYDPMLPNSAYEIPASVRAFLEKYQTSGGTVYFNMDRDQFKTMKGAPNNMCGAYAALAIKMMDLEASPAVFYDIHERINRMGDDVKAVFNRIRGAY